MRSTVALVIACGGCDVVLGLEERAPVMQLDAALPDGAGSMLTFDGAALASLTRPIADDFTIELWFRTSAPAGGTEWHTGRGLVYGDFPGSGDDFGLAITEGNVAFGIGNPDRTLRSNVGVTDGTWHHVAATRNKTTGRIALILDGVLQAELVHSNRNALAATTKLYVGFATSVGAPDKYFAGDLDELRLWSVERSLDEIATDRDRVLAGAEGGLVSYYRFDEGNGLRAEDSSSGMNPCSLGEAVVDMAPTWAPSTAPIFAR